MATTSTSRLASSSESGIVTGMGEARLHLYEARLQLYEARLQLYEARLQLVVARLQLAHNYRGFTGTTDGSY